MSDDAKVTDPTTGQEVKIDTSSLDTPTKIGETPEEPKVILHDNPPPLETHKEPVKKTYVLMGVTVTITDEVKAEFDKLHEELNKVLGDRLLSDVSLSDEYYRVKRDLEAFIASHSGN